MTDEIIQTNKPKRTYQYSSKQRARIAAQRAAKRAENEAKTARSLANLASKKSKRARRIRDKALEFSDKVAGTADNYVTTEADLWKATPVAEKIVKDKDVEIIFEPSEKQKIFLAASEREVLYGGAAGGGKSYAMLADPIRFAHNKNMRALLLRRNMPELLELIDKSRELYPRVFGPDVRFKEKDHRWEFPSGATLQFSFVEDDKDVIRFQGSSFSWYGIDELTHYPTPFVWNYLRSRLRTVDPTLPVYARATSNPGGVGGWWVKKMFIDPAPWGKAFLATDIDTGEILRYPNIEAVSEELRGKPLFKRRFIPARLTDNKYLMQSSQYLANLSSLPEVQRKRLLEGDWDIAEDTAFPEFDRKIHVEYDTDFKIPEGWKRYRACDYGYVNYAAVLWFAVSYDGTIYVYRELYEKGLDGDALAEKIIELEWDDHGILTGPLDNETWSQRGQRGMSPAEAMIRKGVRWVKADKGPGSRVRGKVELHKRLRVDNFTGKPGLVILAKCRNLIRILPLLPLDETNPEDVDKDFPEDHLYDALRYGVEYKTKYSLYPEERARLNQLDKYVPFDSEFGV